MCQVFRYKTVKDTLPAKYNTLYWETFPQIWPHWTSLFLQMYITLVMSLSTFNSSPVPQQKTLIIIILHQTHTEANIHSHICIHTQKHIQTYVQTYINTQAYTSIYTWTYIYTNTYMDIHTYINTHIQIYAHTFKHKHTDIHVNICINTYTYKHIHAYTSVLWRFE